MSAQPLLLNTPETEERQTDSRIFSLISCVPNFKHNNRSHLWEVQCKDSLFLSWWRKNTGKDIKETRSGLGLYLYAECCQCLSFIWCSDALACARVPASAYLASVSLNEASPAESECARARVTSLNAQPFPGAGLCGLQSKRRVRVHVRGYLCVCVCGSAGWMQT